MKNGLRNRPFFACIECKLVKWLVHSMLTLAIHMYTHMNKICLHFPCFRLFSKKYLDSKEIYIYSLTPSEKFCWINSWLGYSPEECWDIHFIIGNKMQLSDAFTALYSSPSPVLNTICGSPFFDRGTNCLNLSYERSLSLLWPCS